MHVVMLKFVMHVVYNAIMLKFVMHVVYNAKVCNACSI